MESEKEILKLIEEINKSKEKETYLEYIKEVTEKCDKLCNAGENIRVLNEYNYMIKNIKKKVLR